ncbi:MAG: LysM peptidoglycan-binding domain-containing protein, partial [Microvirgula sp.]
MKKIALAALASLFLAPGCLAAEAVTEWHYHVYQGDTLWSIATRHLKDVSYIPALQRLNRITNAHAILTGKDIRI